MCGIAGRIGGSEAPSAPEVRAVLDSLRHRGPDAEGQWCADGVWLGFRRLSILDLASRADQPMVDEEAGVALVFNGEIYNYVELREQLVALGHRFVTTGDTEVVLRGWIEWGEGLFPRCNGMWAIAVHQRGAPGVILSRDRFGEKPLYVGAARDGTWWFGSEVRALREAGAGTGRLQLGRALGFLLLGDVEDPTDSYLDGITQVPPGTVAHLTPRGIVATRRWFSAQDLVAGAWGCEPARDDEVRAGLDDAVRLRLRSDVPVGTSLSGGVDSSTIVASLRSVDPVRTLHAFTATFPGEQVDELDHARLVAERFSVQLHPVEPTLDGFLAELDPLLLHQGAPIEGPTVYAQWCVQRAARDEGVTVLLDGQGADETWGGYAKYVGASMASDLLGLRPGRLAAQRRGWRRFGDRPSPDVRQLAALAAPRPLLPRMLALSRRSEQRWLGEAFVGVALQDPQGPPATGNVTARAAGADLGRVILPRLLRYADRNSMAMSREMRLPFLDPAVVDLALRSDWDRGFRTGWTKLALRRAVSHRLPQSIAWRREKVAYATPEAAWRSDSRTLALETAARHDLVDRGVLARPDAPFGGWRLIALSRFLDLYGLRT
jgi:asparagine synthase (glutamine-hydrolysing)